MSLSRGRGPARISSSMGESGDSPANMKKAPPFWDKPWDEKNTEIYHLPSGNWTWLENFNFVSWLIPKGLSAYLYNSCTYIIYYILYIILYVLYMWYHVIMCISRYTYIYIHYTSVVPPRDRSIPSDVITKGSFRGVALITCDVINPMIPMMCGWLNQLNHENSALWDVVFVGYYGISYVEWDFIVGLCGIGIWRWFCGSLKEGYQKIAVLKTGEMVIYEWMEWGALLSNKPIVLVTNIWSYGKLSNTQQSDIFSQQKCGERYGN